MKMRASLSLLLILMLALIAPAQTRNDYLGEWFGYITQEPAGLAARYIFELELEDAEGGITGEARLRLEDDPEVYGIMEIASSYENAQINVVELYIKAQKMYTYGYWCLKDYQLTATWVQGVLVLEGRWESGNCGNANVGFIHLERRLS
jgi:hypothetical protein